MHKGTQLEAVFTMGGNLTDPEYSTNPVSKFVLQMVEGCISLDVIKWTRMAKRCKGVIDEMITDLLKMNEMVTKGELLFPMVNVNNWKTKFKFDHVYGCRSGARVFVAECDHICALQACMEGIQNNTINENIGHPDNEIDRTELEGLECMKIGYIMLQVNCYDFPDGPDAIVLNSDRFLTDIFSLESLNMLFSSFFMVEEKRQWQSQSEPERRKTRTQAPAHQPKSYELQGLLLQAHRVRELHDLQRRYEQGEREALLHDRVREKD